MKGIHLRYLGEALRVVEGVGVFEKGTVAFAPRSLAIELLSSGDFEAVTNGPTAQVFVVRIGQDTIAPPEVEAERRVEEPADFEKELEEEERRLTMVAETEGRSPEKS
jgi:hypothetical protein